MFDFTFYYHLADNTRQEIETFKPTFKLAGQKITQRIEKDSTATNNAFCASVAEGSPMSSGSLLGLGSGRKS